MAIAVLLQVGRSGSLVGGGIGAAVLAATCTVFAITTAGIGGVACAVIAGGLGAAAGGHGGGVLGQGPVSNPEWVTRMNLYHSP